MSWFTLRSSGQLGVARELVDRAIVAERGMPAKVAWFLDEGALEVFQPGVNGAQYLARLLVGPTVFCLKECLAGEQTYLQTVRVLERARLHPITRPQVLSHLEQNPAMCLTTLIEVSRAFCGAARLEGNRMVPTESLLAHALLAYADVCGNLMDGARHLRVRRTQADLADCVGATERRVNSILGGWRREGVIQKGDGMLIVADRDALLQLVEDNAVTLVHRGKL